MNFIDLFSGAGGLSEGFIKAGFQPVSHVEMDTAACFTLKTRAAFHYLKTNNSFDTYVQYLKGQISRSELYDNVPAELLDSVINLAIGKENNNTIFRTIDNHLRGQNVDLIIGGPPCQAYSLVGRARSENNMKRDPRNHLYVQYGKFLEKYQPKMFVFENVLGLRSASNGQYLANMEKLFDKKGYSITINTVNAKDFGVLQKRKRLIIIGVKRGLNLRFPDIEAFRSELIGSVDHILNDLPKLSAGDGFNKNGRYSNIANTYLTESAIRNGIDVLTQHISRPHTDQDKKIYEIAVNKWDNNQERLNYNDLPIHLKTHNNITSFTDRFKVVAAELDSSHTVVAHIAKDGHYYIHPDKKQNRSISVREAARLQSFPDDFYFEGVKESTNRTAAFKQIGNAVPPLMGEFIANMIRQTLCQI
ncbi:DNA cytosine methyltransferase [Mucilaginibacter lappiensis]|uniref:Cytosine-specific methyltransferase n=1 Tax=Mucilaginibacter lappiensis TaxID=354630 RepID=A0A841JEA0_9SPHI|nr:DNA cytosine methyltransferase [Mucilaginibacter lappiensis]MBB6128632.1 DNA (cytosine-5)-methyltransferase 1 [Mucilaginibacter lappiensis]